MTSGWPTRVNSEHQTTEAPPVHFTPPGKEPTGRRSPCDDAAVHSEQKSSRWRAIEGVRRRLVYKRPNEISKMTNVDEFRGPRFMPHCDASTPSSPRRRRRRRHP
jgi:hypothetical protein